MIKSLNRSVFVLLLIMLQNAFAAPPGIPVLNGPSHDSDGNYQLDWNNVTGARIYKVEERPSENIKGNLIYSGFTQNMFITGRGNGSWHYQVIACNENNECSEPSNTISVVVSGK